VLPTLLALGAICFVAWLSVLFRRGRPWDMRPVAEDAPAPPLPSVWPRIRVLVPARNEAASLPRTLPALAAQDYPGEWSIVVVDDRSTDGTAERARSLGGPRCTVLPGKPLPDGWVGKVWALRQGAEGATEDYLLLTDADILHAPGSLRRLVAESEHELLGLNSRMARLRCESAAERLLIPPFVWFFNLLYPMRLVDEPGRAAAAGGCMLVRRVALEAAGGFESIRSEIIDDVNLARRIQDVDRPLRLTLSRSDVRSLREYGSLGPIWTMVRRTAFTELRRSWLRVLGAQLSIALMFVVPLLLLAAGALLSPRDPRFLAVAGLGLLSWISMAVLHAPAPRFFGLSGFRALLLPLAGALYGLMTLDSALRGGRRDWR
jgi:hopene-associated glycosyltransferase HpnB